MNYYGYDAPNDYLNYLMHARNPVTGNTTPGTRNRQQFNKLKEANEGVRLLGRAPSGRPGFYYISMPDGTRREVSRAEMVEMFGEEFAAALTRQSNQAVRSDIAAARRPRGTVRQMVATERAREAGMESNRAIEREVRPNAYSRFNKQNRSSSTMPSQQEKEIAEKANRSRILEEKKKKSLAARASLKRR